MLSVWLLMRLSRRLMSLPLVDAALAFAAGPVSFAGFAGALVEE
jgi:hypothetical protein